MNNSEINTVIFLNTSCVDMQRFRATLIRVRELPQLKALAFVRFKLSSQLTLNAIKHLLFWRKLCLEDILFIDCSMDDADLKFLFASINLAIQDFSRLHRLVVADNPLVKKTTLTKMLRDLDAWKAHRVTNAIVKLSYK